MFKALRLDVLLEFGWKDYAESSAVEFGIADCFVAFLSKSNVLLDDQLVADWRLCLQVHPLSLDDKSLDEYWLDIKRTR